MNILECAMTSEGCCEVGGGSEWLTSGVLGEQAVCLGQVQLSSVAFLLPTLLVPRRCVYIRSRTPHCLCAPIVLLSVCDLVCVLFVTQPLYESRMNWVYDPAPPASRRATVDFSDTPVNSSDTPVHTSDTPASAIGKASPGAPLASPNPKKSRRRRRRRNRRSANENSAPRSATPVTPDERWANKNSASQRATQPQSAASDPTQMMSTPVYQEQSFHSSHLLQPPVQAANRNAAFQFGLDRCRFPGLYKPAHPDPRQDLTANPSRVNNSGSGFSSPSLLQPCTKTFTGLPARQQMTCPTREAGEAIRERPGVVYPLLPRAQRPDTRDVIEAALPEAAALDRRAQPPTVLEIGDTSLPQQASSSGRRSSRRQSRKRRRNRSTGVYWPPKHSPPHGRWCE